MESQFSSLMRIVIKLAIDNRLCKLAENQANAKRGHIFGDSCASSAPDGLVGPVPSASGGARVPINQCSAGRT
jgi:hypothetical protein